MGKQVAIEQSAEQQLPTTQTPITPVRPVDTGTHTATFTPPTTLPSENGTTPETVENDGKQEETETKTFTQAEIDRIIAARLDQERKKYADYDTVKAELARLKTPAPTPAPEANTDQRLTALETQSQALTKRNQELTIEAAIVKQAATIGLDPTAAAKLVDTSKLTVGEDGNIAGLEDAVKAIADQYPGLLARQARTKPVNPGRGSDPSIKTDAQRRAEYFGGVSSNFWSGGGVVLNSDE